MAKFDIKTVKPKFVVTTSPENKIDVVVSKPIIEAKNSKSFFQLKNTGGPRGLKGEQGEPGQDSTIEVVSTTTGAAGTNASVVNQGTASAAQLAFTIPRGDKGETGAAGYSPSATVSKVGDTATITITDKNGTTTASVSDGQDGAAGAPGQAATIEVASTSTLPAGSSATVTNVGTQSAARLAFGIPKGDTGAAGADGDAATIQVGQVETLQPNQPAYVNNVGTSSQAIFNIGIPKGDKGDSGSGSGDMTASVYDPNGTVAAAGGIPDYVDSNGGKIDTIEVNGTPQTITNKTVDITVPTDTSDLTNGAGYITSSSLPTVNNATLTIQKNGTTVQTFTANSSSDKTANITVPTDTSDLTNGAGYITSSALPTVNDATLTITQNGVTAGTFTANASSDNTIALTDTTYSAMTGATAGAAGTTGLVPAPAAGDQDKVLSGAGTWVDQSGGGAFVGYFNVPSDTISSGTYTLYTDTSYTTGISGADVKTALADGKNVLLYFNDNKYIKVHSWKEIGTANVFMASFDKNGLAELTATIAKPSGWNLFGFMTTLKNINNGTLTIQHNGTTVDTFAANADTNKTVNIETIYADTITPTTAVATIGTTQIADAAVTSAKIDWSTIDYSTAQPIGTFDNKTLYRKTYDIGYLSSTDVSVSHGLPAGFVIVSIQGACKQSNGTTVAIPNISTSSENLIGAYTNSSSLHVLSYKSRTGDKAIINIEYYV